ncbi:hypothetical protein ABWK22_08410 [Gottfriedia acidiceleris]
MFHLYNGYQARSAGTQNWCQN